MEVTRYDSLDAGPKAPYVHNGKIVFHPKDNVERDGLVAFLDRNIGKFTYGSAVAQTSSHGKIFLWVSAPSPDIVREVISDVIAAVSQRAPKKA